LVLAKKKEDKAPATKSPAKDEKAATPAAKPAAPVAPAAK
jgi:hypothetical protein